MSEWIIALAKHLGEQEHVSAIVRAKDLLDHRSDGARSERAKTRADLLLLELTAAEVLEELVSSAEADLANRIVVRERTLDRDQRVRFGRSREEPGDERAYDYGKGRATSHEGWTTVGEEVQRSRDERAPTAQ